MHGKSGPRHLLQWIHILFDHTKTFPRAIFLSLCLNETYSTVHIGKLQSDKFPIQNGLKQGDALSPLLLNFALENAIRRVQENQEWDTPAFGLC
jgi:hypothetical protein